jgi:GNAT superfamily N-acetyltransferase
MTLDKAAMLSIVRSRLAADMNCDPQDFLSDGIAFCEAAPNKGIWLDERQTPHLRAATMGKGIVVCADSELLKKVRPILYGKERDELFSAPFFLGHSIYYIPDIWRLEELPCPDGFSLETREAGEIQDLYAFPGFGHAIWYDVRHPRPDALVVYATHGGKIAGMAGASADCENMWQIGIDVLPPFCGKGLASCLVSRLAVLIMKRGIVPFYCTGSSNIPSQLVAYRCGFAPAWMCTYKHALDGKSPFDAICAGFKQLME